MRLIAGLGLLLSLAAGFSLYANAVIAVAYGGWTLTTVLFVAGGAVLILGFAYAFARTLGGHVLPTVAAWALLVVGTGLAALFVAYTVQDPEEGWLWLPVAYFAALGAVSGAARIVGPVRALAGGALVLSVGAIWCVVDAGAARVETFGWTPELALAAATAFVVVACIDFDAVTRLIGREASAANAVALAVSGLLALIAGLALVPETRIYVVAWLPVVVFALVTLAYAAAVGRLRETPAPSPTLQPEGA